MPLRVFHQVGHNPNWNVDSFEQDGCGDGLILSPVHQKRQKVEGLGSALRRRCLFDPQFYLPNSPKPKLKTYEFFPEQISSGFSTVDFPLYALQSARLCLDFQAAQGFEALVIPARFFDQMTPRYFQKQNEYTVHPFLTALNQAGHNGPVYLTVPVTTAMLQDAEFRVQILNWITGFPELTGVYALVCDDRETKQICSANSLLAQMEFAREVLESDLSLVLGHLNTESLVLSVVGDVTLTFGTFENTRMFSMDKFIDAEERWGPKPRIYMPGLLNWIQFEHAVQLRDEAPELWEAVHQDTPHAEIVLSSPAEPHFSQPHLYKHHFVCMQDQISQLKKHTASERVDLLKEWIQAAAAYHEEVAEVPVDLDTHGSGRHLQPWLAALEAYSRR